MILAIHIYEHEQQHNVECKSSTIVYQTAVRSLSSLAVIEQLIFARVLPVLVPPIQSNISVIGTFTKIAQRSQNGKMGIWEMVQHVWMFYFYIDVSRAGEQVNFLGAPAPDFFFKASPAPDFFPRRLWLLLFFSSGSGSSSKWPNKTDPSPDYWLSLAKYSFPA